MHSRAEALLLLLLKLVVSVLEMASDKRKAKKMLKFKEMRVSFERILKDLNENERFQLDKLLKE